MTNPSQLEPPDTHFFSAAEGWLELGDAREAMAEWERISEEGRAHFLALELAWQIQATLPDWAAAARTADELATRHPMSCAGWLHRAYALRRLPGGGLERALTALRPAADLFPEEEIIAYNLSCYVTQLGREDDGWEWFLRAMQLAKEPARMRAMALGDTDLQPLWVRIRALKQGG